MSFPAHKLPLIHHQLPLAVLQVHVSLHCCESLPLWIMHLPVFLFLLLCPPSPCIHYATQLLNYYRGVKLTFRASQILICQLFVYSAWAVWLFWDSLHQSRLILVFILSLEAIQKASNKHVKYRDNTKKHLREETEKERSGKTSQYYLAYSSASPFSQLCAG